MLEKKQQAYLRYVEQGMTAKETATITGIHPNTMTNWIKRENWKMQRHDRLIAPTRLMAMYYEISESIAERIRDAQGLPLKGDIDNLNKLSAVIKKMERQKENTNHLKVIMEFNLYLVKVNPQLAGQLFSYEKEFLQHVTRQKDENLHKVINLVQPPSNESQNLTSQPQKITN